jgi:hypothetical protein
MYRRQHRISLPGAEVWGGKFAQTVLIDDPSVTICGFKPDVSHYKRQLSLS